MRRDSREFDLFSLLGTTLFEEVFVSEFFIGGVSFTSQGPCSCIDKIESNRLMKLDGI